MVFDWLMIFCDLIAGSEDDVDDYENTDDDAPSDYKFPKRLLRKAKMGYE